VNNLVSVIVPAYNSNGTICKAVTSALHQKDVTVEVLVVDNGGTLDVKRLPYAEVGSNLLRVINIPVNHGVAKARNLGVQEAKGDYIAFLDADDWWAEDKLAKQLRLMEQEDKQGEKPRLCYSGRQLCTPEGNATKRYVHAKERVDYQELLKHNVINCSSVLMARETALQYPMNRDQIHEDYVCWLKLLRDGGYAAGIDEPLLYYRMSRKSKSGNKLRSAVMTYRVYKYMKLPLGKRLYYFTTYTWNGIKKYL
jgi:teichuronic acid biosynthesis glycosyltransferase TuaG